MEREILADVKMATSLMPEFYFNQPTAFMVVSAKGLTPQLGITTIFLGHKRDDDTSYYFVNLPSCTNFTGGIHRRYTTVKAGSPAELSVILDRTYRSLKARAKKVYVLAWDLIEEIRFSSVLYQWCVPRILDHHEEDFHVVDLARANFGNKMLSLRAALERIHAFPVKSKEERDDLDHPGIASMYIGALLREWVIGVSYHPQALPLPVPGYVSTGAQTSEGTGDQEQGTDSVSGDAKNVPEGVGEAVELWERVRVGWGEHAKAPYASKSTQTGW